MPRPRIFAAGIALALVAAACGGGEDGDPADAAGGADPAAAASDADASEDTSPEVPVMTEPDEQEDSPSGAATASPVEPEAPAEPDTVVEYVPIQLGSRFGWCAEVQATWDDYDRSLEKMLAAETALQEAEDAYGSATDELDRAEALIELEKAQRIFPEAVEAHDSGRHRAANGVAWTYQLQSGGSTHPQGVAYKRAWSAFVDHADEPTLAAIDGYEEALAALDAGTQAEEDVQQAREAHQSAVAEMESIRNAPIYVDFGPTLELQAPINAEHYAAVEALGPPPPTSWQSAEEISEAWQAALLRIEDALDTLEYADEADAVLDTFIPLVAPIENDGEADYGVEAINRWSDSVRQLAEARSDALRGALRDYGNKLDTEAREAREAEYQAAAAAEAAAYNALANAQLQQGNTIAALNEAVDWAKTALLDALAATIPDSAAYHAYRLSFQESCA